MKLFLSPGACSLAPHIVLHWVGAEFEAVKVDLKNGDPEYKKLNPLGSVPALMLDDGRLMNQADAILSYLAESYPQANLGGQGGVDSFELNRWLAFLTGDLHPAFFPFFRAQRFTTDHSESSLKAVNEAAQIRIHQILKVLDNHLGDSNHIVHDRRTIADPYAFAMLRWVNLLDKKLDAHPNLQRFVDTFVQDETVQKVLEIEANL